MQSSKSFLVSLGLFAACLPLGVAAGTLIFEFKPGTSVVDRSGEFPALFSDSVIRFDGTIATATRDTRDERAERDTRIEFFGLARPGTITFAAQASSAWSLDIGDVGNTGAGSKTPPPEPQDWATLMAGASVAGGLAWRRLRPSRA